VPEHAHKLLDRLLGQPEPYRDLQEVRADLQATRGRAAEVTRSRRAGHVALLAALWSVGLGFMMFPALLAGFVTLMEMSVHLRQGWILLEELQAEAPCDFAAGMFNSQPFGRAAAAYELRADLDLSEDLRKQLGRDRREFETRRQSASSLSRALLPWFERLMEPQLTPTLRAGARRPLPLRWLVRRRMATGFANRNFESFLDTPTRIFITIGPAVWVVWALVFRGGLSYPLLGLSLVRADGRRAGRPRCAWRAFLVWAPLTALVLTAVALGAINLSFTEGTHPPWWQLWLAELLRWLSLGLLLSYPVLAIGFPRRSLHDWLAGTYLVPR
jgi:hypothetical protein